MTKTADIEEIKRALGILFQSGDVVELRALNVSGKTHAGYFNDFEKLSNAAASLSGQADGVYVILNQVNPELLARAANRIKSTRNEKLTVTQDKDIIRRRWLPIDIDAKRPAGISSTEVEHEAALQAAYEIRAWIADILNYSAQNILIGDSGNGAHVLLRIDAPNDDESTKVIRQCLKSVAAKFESNLITIDQSVFNAARIWKLYGTMACKGDSTPERPHRIAQLKEYPHDTSS